MNSPSGKEVVFHAGTDATGRLDAWLAARIPELSRVRIQTLIRSGNITVDGAPMREHKQIKPGQQVRVCVPPPTPAVLTPQSIPLNIIYQDADVIVINKSPGIVVHPAAGHPDGTLANALLHHCPDLADIGSKMRPGIVHRLDRDTSGLIVVAKNDGALNSLATQFKYRRVRKEYLALVRGVPPETGVINAAIGRHPTQRKKMALNATGRSALTSYVRLAVYCDYAALIRLCIHTGRTHQIRVHMAHVGHPVLGDRTYGRRSAVGQVLPSRQMLHAARLAFAHPSDGRLMEFNAFIPGDMRECIRALSASMDNKCRRATPAVPKSNAGNRTSM